MSAPPAVTAEAARRLAERCGGSVNAGFGDVTVDVPVARWVEALTLARDSLGLNYFDWLSAVDELDAGFSVLCHLATVAPVAPVPAAGPGPGGAAGAAGQLVHLMVRTRVPLAFPVLATATGVFPGASWHERETWEMFGIDFEGHPNLVPLLLPDGFVGRPLRKEFELQARLARPWPGAKDPAKGGAGR